ncbi:MAG: hypothetical protein IT372_19150 [Polyangiaceae bacterium]|nr:hypothetical protein [Polyangiaceae bacterium]
MTPRSPGIAAALLLACLTGAGRAGASAFDLQGFGPAGVAEAGARAARAEDGTATFYNPGGLGLGRGAQIEIAPALGVSALEAAGRALPLEDPFGIAVALAATVPLEGPLAGRLRVGFGAYAPPSSVLRLIARRADEPSFPYFDNRTQRLVLLPALAARITDGLSIGAGADVLGGVSGPADVRGGASGAPEPRIDVQATTIAAARVGVRFDPAPGVRLGLVYRQRFSVPARIATAADVGGVPLEVTVDVRDALFDPDTVVLASSFDIGPAALELDATYAAWSAYEGPLVQTEANLPGVHLVSAPPPDLFRDVVGLRAAATYRLPIGAQADVIGRAGAGIEPSILTGARQGRTDLVDGAKVLAGLGATLELRGLLPGALRVGAGINVTAVAVTAQEKIACARAPCPPDTVAGPDAAAPGAGITDPGYPRLEAGGALWSGSLGIGVDL